MALLCESTSNNTSFSSSSSRSNTGKDNEARSCTESSSSEDDITTTLTTNTSTTTTTNSKKKRKKLTHSHHKRRSKRGNSSISHLAEAITSNKNVLFITGAGLSASCGIRTFRGESGLWSEVVMSCGTRESFRRDPLEWYNEFWLKHFPTKLQNTIKPSVGHEALAELTTLKNTNIRIITQNIDGLHDNTACKWDYKERLIEAHGKISLYKCIPLKEDDDDDDDDYSTDEEDERPVKLGNKQKNRELISAVGTTNLGSNNSKRASPVCQYEILESISTDMLEPFYIREALTKSSNDSESPILPSPPLCPKCLRPCLPQALLFDEQYHSHSHYQFIKAENWIASADIIVFVGTSYSVLITEVALSHAREHSIPVYNFNLDERLESSVRLNVENIIGYADETLCLLLSACEEEIKRKKI